MGEPGVELLHIGDDGRHLVERVDAVIGVGAVGRNSLGRDRGLEPAALAAVDIEIGGLAQDDDNQVLCFRVR